MKLSEYVDPELVTIGVAPGDLRAILSQLIAPVVRNPAVTSPESVLQALLARETVLSTGIGNGVAIPHAISESVPYPSLAIGISPEGVEFRAIDGARVHVFFVLLSPPDGGAQHIKLLARLARLARNADFVGRLRTCTEATRVVEHIARYEREHP